MRPSAGKILTQMMSDFPIESRPGDTILFIALLCSITLVMVSNNDLTCSSTVHSGVDAELVRLYCRSLANPNNKYAKARYLTYAKQIRLFEGLFNGTNDFT